MRKEEKECIYVQKVMVFKRSRLGLDSPLWYAHRIDHNYHSTIEHTMNTQLFNKMMNLPL